MTSVNCYTVHMTNILSPMGLPIFVCFRFRYKFHLLEDLLRESLDLCHDFTGLQVVLFFCCLLLMFFYKSFSCLSLIESVFFVDTFGVFFYSSIEFISLYSLFTLSFYFIVHVRYTYELYRRGTYL